MKIFTVDAFTDKLFSGNPAGVCILDEDMSENTMLSIAAEMNLSETAFVKKIDEGFNLKWFTPKVEVQLCGHATLATAHILWEQGILSQNDEARFHTLSGLLTVTNDNGEYEMNFPYLYDETQETARKYGAVCTPDIYVYDKDRVLRYRGRLDDNWKDESSIKAKDLEKATELLLEGKEIDFDQIPSMGCSIKWKS